MAFVVVPVADRNTIALDPDADAQPWRGIAGDGNALRFSRLRSQAKRCWCTISDNDKFIRLTQGASFLGHFSTNGETVIATNQNPGTSLKIAFDPPITGVGMDVEPVLPGNGAGQSVRMELTVTQAGTGTGFAQTANGVGGASQFIALRSNTDDIAGLELKVFLLDAAGNPTGAVDFAINRLELIAAVGNIV